jgi:hypothetical protein
MDTLFFIVAKPIFYRLVLFPHNSTNCNHFSIVNKVGSHGLQSLDIGICSPPFLWETSFAGYLRQNQSMSTFGYTGVFFLEFASMIDHLTSVWMATLLASIACTLSMLTKLLGTHIYVVVNFLWHLFSCPIFSFFFGVYSPFTYYALIILNISCCDCIK